VERTLFAAQGAAGTVRVMLFREVYREKNGLDIGFRDSRRADSASPNGAEAAVLR
jgi:hypothetical protein